MSRLSIAFATLIFSLNASAASYNFFDKVYDVEHERLFGNVNIKVGVMKSAAAKANVIYMHGFADTMDNHQVLLTNFRDSGLNVVAFDFPSHGDSGGHIWTWSMKQVAEIIHTIMNDKSVEFDRDLPIILAGWSTGATMALRISQEWAVTGISWKRDILPRHKIVGLILYAPSVPANFTVGDEFIFPELDTLTRSRTAIRNAPRPSATLAAANFTASLKIESELARSAATKLPKDLPILTIIAGDNDLYTTSSNTVAFVKNQAAKGVQIVGFQCTNSFHAIEFEPDNIGSTANSLAVKFASAIASNPTRRVENTRQFKSLNFRACPRVK